MPGAHEPFTDTAGVPAAVPGYGKSAAEFGVQCRACLQAWPCETALLLAELDQFIAQVETLQATLRARDSN